MQFDHQSNTIIYQQATPQVSPPPSPTVISIQNTPVKNNIQHTKYTLLIPDIEAPNLPSADTYNTDSNSQETITKFETYSDHSWELYDESHQPNVNFEFLHSNIHHTIETWALEPSAKQHPFYPIWQKALFHGLKSITTWNKLKQIFQIHNYGEYITMVTQCPKVTQTYHLTWDESNNTVGYTRKQTPTIDIIEEESTRLSKFHNQLQYMAHSFVSSIQFMQQQWMICEQNLHTINKL